MSKYEQTATFLNTVLSEVVNGAEIVTENLSNIVDIGNKYITENNFEAFTKKLIDRIYRTDLAIRPYTGYAPTLYMDGDEWGGICQKISFTMPKTQDNKSFSLVDKQSYDPNIFYQPVVTQKFFSDIDTFEVPLSLSYEATKSAFLNRDSCVSYFDGLRMCVDNAMGVFTDILKQRTLTNFIAQTLYNDYKDPETTTPYGNSSHLKAVNLLFEYNTVFSDTLTVNNCLTNEKFLRFAIKRINDISRYMRGMSTLFNVEKQERHTPYEYQRFYKLSDFDTAIKYYARPIIFNNGDIELPEGDVVPFWQGSGNTYNIDTISDIHVNIKDLTTPETTHEVISSGILAVLCDRDALGVHLYDIHDTTYYNAVAEFTNTWRKGKGNYFNDYSENFVVFFIADKKGQ